MRITLFIFYVKKITICTKIIYFVKKIWKNVKIHAILTNVTVDIKFVEGEKMSNADTIALLAGMGALLLVVGVVAIIFYVIYGISHMKAYKMMGYKNAWGAWIPLYSSYVLADCIPETKENVNIFGLSIPGTVFKFWWILSFVVAYVPGIGTLLSLAVTIICAGYCYTSIYSILEGKSKDEVKVVGYLSGWLSIIASIKFLTIKK